MAKKRSSVISVLITGDNRELSSALDDSSNRLATFGKAAGVALAAAGVAFGVFAKKAIDAAIEAEAAQTRLATILTNTGMATEEQIRALNAQAAALETVGVASASNITVLQAQLATFDLSAEAIEALTPAITDYVIAEKGATASAGDFQSAANGLAQALQGNFGALSRVGFVLDETTKEMIKNGTEAQRTAALVEVLNSTYEGFNETARMTSEGQLVALKNQFSALQETIGMALIPIFRELVQVLSLGAERLEVLWQKHGPRIVAFIDAFYIAVSDLWYALRDRLVPILRTVRERLAELYEDLRGPLDDVRGRIEAFVDAAKVKFGEFRDAVPDAVKELKEFFSEIRELADDPEALGFRLGSMLASAVYEALRTLRDQSQRIYEAFRELFARVNWGQIGRDTSSYMAAFAVGFAAGLISLDWVGPVLRVLKDNWQAVLIGALSVAFSPAAVVGRLGALLAKIPLAGRFLSWLVTSFNRAFAPIRDFLSVRVGLLFQSFANGFLTAIRGGGPTLVSRFVNFLLFIPRAIIKAFDDLILNTAIGFGRFGAAIGNGIRAFVSKAGEFFAFLMTPFRTFGRTLIDDLFMLGKNVIGALMNGIRSMLGALTNLVKSVGRSVWDQLSRLWQISSPSKVFMDMGRQVGVGLALGIESSERLVRDATSFIGDAASASALVNGIQGGGRAAAPINVTVNGALDAEGVARQIRQILQDAERRTGVRL